MKTLSKSHRFLNKNHAYGVVLSIFQDSRIDSRFWPKLVVKKQNGKKNACFSFLNIFSSKSASTLVKKNKNHNLFGRKKISTIEKRRRTPLRFNMSPETWWLEDCFPMMSWKSPKDWVNFPMKSGIPELKRQFTRCFLTQK